MTKTQELMNQVQNLKESRIFDATEIRTLNENLNKQSVEFYEAKKKIEELTTTLKYTQSSSSEYYKQIQEVKYFLTAAGVPENIQTLGCTYPTELGLMARLCLFCVKNGFKVIPEVKDE